MSQSIKGITYTQTVRGIPFNELDDSNSGRGDRQSISRTRPFRVPWDYRDDLLPYILGGSFASSGDFIVRDPQPYEPGSYLVALEHEFTPFGHRYLENGVLKAQAADITIVYGFPDSDDSDDQDADEKVWASVGHEYHKEVERIERQGVQIGRAHV